VDEKSGKVYTVEQSEQEHLTVSVSPQGCNHRGHRWSVTLCVTRRGCCVLSMNEAEDEQTSTAGANCSDKGGTVICLLKVSIAWHAVQLEG